MSQVPDIKDKLILFGNVNLFPDRYDDVSLTSSFVLLLICSLGKSQR